MRKRFTLSNVLDLYRKVSVIVGLFLSTAGLSALASWLSYKSLGMATLTRGLWYVMALAMLGALVTLYLAYPRVRRALVKAEEERNAILASAHRDALTGVFTRAYFLDALKNRLRHDAGEPVGYMLIDLDHLKAMNDGNGHAAGDAMLVHLTDTIQAMVPEAMIGRLGGDEFGVAFIGHGSKAGLRRLAEQILARFAEPTIIGGRRMRLSATIGVAAAPADGVGFDELTANADLALYQGKRAGRGVAVAFEADMLGEERHKRFVERELRAAMLMNELDLYYQPIYAADGVTLISSEALVRWHHPVRGTISPGQFIEVAEQSDLIDKLGEWVLRRACLDLAVIDSPSININVSPAQLRRSEFMDGFAAILAETGADGSRLIVEITETVPLTKEGVEMANLAGLRALGVRIAIDDFGAGHTNLQYLRGFAFDMIKIDKSYVANVSANLVDGQIVRAICAVAQTIGADVVAEGIETPEQLAILQGFGVTALQGYLLGRPVRLVNRGADGMASAA